MSVVGMKLPKGTLLRRIRSKAGMNEGDLVSLYKDYDGGRGSSVEVLWRGIVTSREPCFFDLVQFNQTLNPYSL
jgi:hypothetical protein